MGEFSARKGMGWLSGCVRVVFDAMVGSKEGWVAYVWIEMGRSKVQKGACGGG